jgi:hypothetical protein
LIARALIRLNRQKLADVVSKDHIRYAVHSSASEPELANGAGRTAAVANQHIIHAAASRSNLDGANVLDTIASCLRTRIRGVIEIYSDACRAGRVSAKLRNVQIARHCATRPVGACKPC